MNIPPSVFSVFKFELTNRYSVLLSNGEEFNDTVIVPPAQPGMPYLIRVGLLNWAVSPAHIIAMAETA